MARFALICLLIVAATNPAKSSPADVCWNAYLDKNWEAAARECRKAAEQGNSMAQSYLGTLYETGRGVPKSMREAVRWHRGAAVGGSLASQISLALSYLHGRGVSQDYTMAVRWFRVAAERDDPAAQIELGLMYSRGQGVSKSLTEAYMWVSLGVEKIGSLSGELTKLEARMDARSITKAKDMAAKKRRHISARKALR